MSYIMESEDETARLVAQEMTGTALEVLRATGLGPGQRALDAGCGPGLITGEMAELVGPRGSVVGLDVNVERIAAASARTRGRSNILFSAGDVRATGLPDSSFDYVWCQFVFEYLGDPAAALAELMRVLRPGGKIVVSDIDGMGMCNWPCPPEVDEGIRLFADVLRQTNFDINIGRKLFHHFRRAGLGEVRVHLRPLYLVAGRADERTLRDWETRFETLAPVALRGFGSPERYRAFTTAYLGMLRDEESLKYAVQVVTEGTKAAPGAHEPR